MRTGLTISGIAHAGVMLWSVLTFATRPYPVVPAEAMPIDIISASDFSKMTAGAKTAPKVETPKPLVEKVAEPKPADDVTAQIDKKAVHAATDTPPPPEPKPPQPKKPPESKPPEPPAPKPQADAKPEPKPDPIAEAIKKDTTKKPEPKKPEAAATPTPPKKPAPPQPPAFDPRQLQALLDKRDPKRVAAAGETLNDNVSLGVSNGQSAVLSQSELDALRARLAQLWNPPAGAKNPQELVVQIRVRLNADGTLNGPPMVLTSGQSPLFAAARDSAVRAIFRGQPFNMLRPEHYEQWKDVEITFDPRDMIRG